MTGADSSTNYEFVELYNAGANSVDLTGWSLKKKISTGSEGSLVSAKLFSGKIIPPNRYLLLGNASGYAGERRARHRLVFLKHPGLQEKRGCALRFRRKQDGGDILGEYPERAESRANRLDQRRICPDHLAHAPKFPKPVMWYYRKWKSR